MKNVKVSWTDLLL